MKPPFTFSQEVSAIVCDPGQCPLAVLPEEAWQAAAQSGVLPFQLAATLGHELPPESDISAVQERQKDTGFMADLERMRVGTPQEALCQDVLDQLRLTTLREGGDSLVAGAIGDCIGRKMMGLCQPQERLALFGPLVTAEVGAAVIEEVARFGNQEAMQHLLDGFLQASAMVGILMAKYGIVEISRASEGALRELLLEVAQQMEQGEFGDSPSLPDPGE